MTELAAKTCTPCRGGVPPLTRAEAEAHRAQTPYWLILDGPMRISRTWKTSDFKSAFAIVGKVAGLAEQEGHHPDVEFGWGYVTVVLYTHKIKGLHENDFILAAKIDAAVG